MLDPTYVGREYAAPETFVVGREHVRAFASAVGLTDPLHHDPHAARAAGHPDVVAPTTFLLAVTGRYRETNPVHDAGLGVDYGRLVHGEQRFVHHAPVRAGDELGLVSRITGIRQAGRHEILETTSELTRDGATVAELCGSFVIRGS